jgi:hypothetical protein
MNVIPKLESRRKITREGPSSNVGKSVNLQMIEIMRQNTLLTPKGTLSWITLELLLKSMNVTPRQEEQRRIPKDSLSLNELRSNSL